MIIEASEKSKKKTIEAIKGIQEKLSSLKTAKKKEKKKYFITTKDMQKVTGNIIWTAAENLSTRLRLAKIYPWIQPGYRTKKAKCIRNRDKLSKNLTQLEVELAQLPKYHVHKHECCRYVTYTDAAMNEKYVDLGGCGRFFNNEQYLPIIPPAEPDHYSLRVDRKRMEQRLGLKEGEGTIAIMELFSVYLMVSLVYGNEDDNTCQWSKANNDPSFMDENLNHHVNVVKFRHIPHKDAPQIIMVDNLNCVYWLVKGTKNAAEHKCVDFMLEQIARMTKDWHVIYAYVASARNPGALRAQVQQQDTYFLLFYRKEEERKGNWPFLGAAAQMALRIPLEVHFQHFWDLLPKRFSGSFWKLILIISGACCPNGSQETSGGSF